MNLSRASELVPVLEQDIVTGVLKPGQKLDEAMLAKRFHVSRTPVREALGKLAASGLVEIRPRRGAIVATISLRELMNMFEMMANLEGICARYAARRITPEEKLELAAAQEACAALATSEQYDDYYDKNMLLHNLIYKTSHNDFLEKQTQDLRLRLSPYRRLQIRIPGRLKSSSDEHGKLVDAILKGDAKLAEKLTRDHVAIQGERFTDVLATLPSNYVQASA
ncbi:MAG: GntR family transcriptional regulator [Sneathiella sp.]|nr:GntR family transcriptional regulator [Sneathiella sp.]